MKKIISILFFTFIVLQAQASSSACGPGVKMVVSSSENPKKTLILVGAAGAIAAVGVIAHKYKIPQKIVVWCRWQKVKVDAKKIIKDIVNGTSSKKQILLFSNNFKELVKNKNIKLKLVEFFKDLRGQASWRALFLFRINFETDKIISAIEKFIANKINKVEFEKKLDYSIERIRVLREKNDKGLEAVFLVALSASLGCAVAILANS